MIILEQPAKEIRYTELDSLRGLAALTVLLGHLGMVWDGFSPPKTQVMTGLLHFLVPLAPEAVILFFVLSGFVLSLPAIHGRPQSYFTFVIRRVFRIYVPYLAALAIAIVASFFLYRYLPNNHQCPNFCWTEPLNWKLIGEHLTFLGVYDTTRFDAPIWSLVYEMRISLVFPFLCALVLRQKERWAFVLAFLLTCAAKVIDKSLSTDSMIALADTLFYAGLFILGISLARDGARIARWFDRLTRLAKIIFTVTCIVFIVVAGHHFNFVLVLLRHRSFRFTRLWLTALGAGGIIVICMNSPLAKRILFWPPIHRLGKMSYSLYLLHFIILECCLHIFYGSIPLPAILCLIFVLSLIVSWYFYQLIELPAMNLGRRLGNFRSQPIEHPTARS